MSTRTETRRPVPDLPKLPWRNNRTKQVVVRAVGHAVCMFAGVSLLVGIGDGAALWSGIGLVASSFLLAASAFRVPPSCCPACTGPLERSAVRHLRARVIFTTATCAGCGAAYEYLRQSFADVE